MNIQEQDHCHDVDVKELIIVARDKNCLRKIANATKVIKGQIKYPDFIYIANEFKHNEAF